MHNDHTSFVKYGQLDPSIHYHRQTRNPMSEKLQQIQFKKSEMWHRVIEILQFSLSIYSFSMTGMPNQLLRIQIYVSLIRIMK